MLACGVQPHILIADDQSDLLDALRLLLKGEGMAMEAVTSPEATLTAVASQQFDLLLMDLNYTSDTTSGREGIDLVARVQEVDRLLPIIVMTGWGSVDLAVAAMRRGVRDFVQKPWDNGDLVRIVRAEVEDGRLRRKRRERTRHGTDSGDVATRPIETVDQARLYGVDFTAAEDDRDIEGHLLGRVGCGVRRSARRDHVGRAGDRAQVGDDRTRRDARAAVARA